MSAETGLASLHPVVRIICFIIFALFLALGGPLQVVWGGLLVGILFSISGFQVVKRAWPMLRRMRWFFLSIFLIYLFMTPGEPIISVLAPPSWLPTQEGVLAAIHRISVLILMVLAVHWLLLYTPRQALVSALYQLVWPLGCLGLSRERFAVRVGLVFEAMEPVQQLVAHRAVQVKGGDKDLNRYANIAAGLMTDIIALSDKVECRSIDVDVATTPPPLQWGWVLVMFVVMMLPTMF